jgi:hypothetical protein
MGLGQNRVGKSRRSFGCRSCEGIKRNDREEPQVAFTKAAVLGFSVGFVASVIVSCIRVPRPAFLISADRRERLSRKEAAAKINDVMEDREILFEILLTPEKVSAGLLEEIRLKAMIDPQWMQLLTIFDKIAKDRE